MKLSESSPLRPPKPEKKHVGAIQALSRGEASEHQQKLALDWIVKELCKAHDLAFHPDQRETDFALGKQFIGKQIIKMTLINIGEYFK